MLRLNNLFNSLTGNGIDKRDANGETKLYRAVRDGNLPRVKKLLRDGADPDIADDHGLTPLHQAAYWGEVDIVDHLLKAGAAANIDNGQGWTPLHSAALAGGMKSRGDVIQSLKKPVPRTILPTRTAGRLPITWRCGQAMRMLPKNCAV